MAYWHCRRPPRGLDPENHFVVKKEQKKKTPQRSSKSKYIDSWSLSLDDGGLKKDVFIDKSEIVVQLGHRPSEHPLRGLLLTLLLGRRLRLLRWRLLRRGLREHNLRLLLLQKGISLEAAGSQRSGMKALNQMFVRKSC